MRPLKPSVEVPGDNETTPRNKPWLRPYIMARSGDLVGIKKNRAVWRFGFSPESEAAQAYGVNIPKVNDTWPGFLWALCDRGGNVIETFIGFALELPDHFREVLNDPLGE